MYVIEYNKSTRINGQTRTVIRTEEWKFMIFFAILCQLSTIETLLLFLHQEYERIRNQHFLQINEKQVKNWTGILHWEERILFQWLTEIHVQKSSNLSILFSVEWRLEIEIVIWLRCISAEQLF